MICKLYECMRLFARCTFTHIGPTLVTKLFILYLSLLYSRLCGGREAQDQEGLLPSRSGGQKPHHGLRQEHHLRLLRKHDRQLR